MPTFDTIDNPSIATPRRLRDLAELMSSASHDLDTMEGMDSDEDHSEALLLKAANEIEDLAKIAERLVYELRKYSADSDVIRRTKEYLNRHKLTTTAADCLRAGNDSTE